MSGRDPHERGRVATSLELFFDLTFVVVFSLTGVQFADHLAEAHYEAALLGFGFCGFAAVWAWINFTWAASAFDTDDWLFRVMTMVQMLGVCILALGAEPLFASLAAHENPNNRVIVLGYVVMRVAMLGQWIRVAVSSPEYRAAALRYIVCLSVAQIGWVAAAVVEVPLAALVPISAALYVVELGGPVLAERACRTPWHPHHIAERYGALTIVTLGEGIVGTVAALQAAVSERGWSVDAVVLGFAALAINLALWWVYFAVPMGDALHLQRHRAFVWGYGHIVVFLALAAFGAGLHVAALNMEHHSAIAPTVVMAAIVVPTAVYLVALSAISWYLTGFDGRCLAADTVGLVVLGVAVAAVAGGLSLVAGIVVVAVAPIITVIVDEVSGSGRRIERLAARAA
ncbi:low temperature requirement protein A [Tsukamurella sp. 8F]|uniref:low temperature requirement protein A n=1 Tax=unclassified Tsukamurella TaxID=2633480 RepID=UPI0023B9FECE|nr:MULTISPECIES: low temperature requirement protein A [unclassified Tsukamurella]MDF0528306.1 low temperature requirement protein A [Tsukamurella sp. 8J]MDF0589504.1 low temperature requirement protein A [Tsukamurella sp. 8F]